MGVSNHAAVNGFHRVARFILYTPFHAAGLKEAEFILTVFTRSEKLFCITSASVSARLYTLIE